MPNSGEIINGEIVDVVEFISSDITIGRVLDNKIIDIRGISIGEIISIDEDEIATVVLFDETIEGVFFNKKEFVSNEIIGDVSNFNEILKNGTVIGYIIEISNDSRAKAMLNAEEIIGKFSNEIAVVYGKDNHQNYERITYETALIIARDYYDDYYIDFRNMKSNYLRSKKYGFDAFITADIIRVNNIPETKFDIDNKANLLILKQENDLKTQNALDYQRRQTQLSEDNDNQNDTESDSSDKIDNNEKNLITATAEACKDILSQLSNEKVIAVVSIQADSLNIDIADFILNESQDFLVRNGMNVVDRTFIDQIIQEQLFQQSGEINTYDAVKIGNLSSANVIITGSVGGSDLIRRVRLKAIDVETARIIAVGTGAF
jgi:hypothetical protein